MSALADRQDNFRASLDPYGAVTHEVFNQPVELVDTNLFASDAALKDAVKREGAAWTLGGLEAFGTRAGSAEFLELGTLANKNPPELDTHDRYGRRVDLVRFHPSYHALMQASIEDGLHSSPWTDPGEGAHVGAMSRQVKGQEFAMPFERKGHKESPAARGAAIFWGAWGAGAGAAAAND
jgi:hypothetical protein